jgi:hypothetical protein
MLTGQNYHTCSEGIFTQFSMIHQWGSNGAVWKTIESCENSIMAVRGGFRHGAGRKSKASKLIEAGFVADWFTPEYQQIKWKSFLESTDQRIALDATRYLTDRIFGKPTQALTHNGNADEPLVVRHIGVQK